MAKDIQYHAEKAAAAAAKHRQDRAIGLQVSGVELPSVRYFELCVEAFGHIPLEAAFRDAERKLATAKAQPRAMTWEDLDAPKRYTIPMGVRQFPHEARYGAYTSPLNLTELLADALESHGKVTFTVGNGVRVGEIAVEYGKVVVRR